MLFNNIVRGKTICSFIHLSFCFGSKYNACFHGYECCACPLRINIGGAQVVGYMQRLLQLKYPALLGHITLSRALEITANHCYVALNYSTELAAACAMGDEGFRVIQLPFTQVGASCTLSVYCVLNAFIVPF